MGQHLIDVHTADRLLSGTLAPEDAPPGFGDVARFLQAARTPPAPLELARCAETVAAMARVVVLAPSVPSVQTRRRAGLSRLLRPRIAATLVAGALALSFGGLAEAGVLPGPLQHAAHVLLGKIGLTVPDGGGGGVVQVTGGPGPSLLPAGSGPGGSTPTGSEHGRNHARNGGRGNVGGTSGTHGSNGGRSGNTGSGTNSSHRSGANGSSSGQSTLDAKGLCNAWSQGRGGERGKKLSASAFRRLQTMAQANGQSVQEFCAGQGTDGSSAYPRSGPGQGGSSDGGDENPSPGGHNGSTTPTRYARGRHHHHRTPQDAAHAVAGDEVS